MSTDTFETPRIHRSSESTEVTPPTIRPGAGEHETPSGPPLSQRLEPLRTAAGEWAARGREQATRGLDAARGAWRRLRQRLRETSIRIPIPRVTSLDTSIVLVWSLAVALVAVQLALVVSPILGIALALLEGVALGASGRRLYRLVTRA
jgi:hypothetical protein